MHISYRLKKRLVDVFVAVILLIMLSPLMVMVAVIIRMNMGKGVFYLQERPGLNERIFTIYKFRTMLPPEKFNLFTDEERVTKLGKWLRSYSIDELPELINVLKGDMSLVGPRPLLVDYLKNYSIKEKQRHEALPGLTGLAQVRGRNELKWRHKFKYDIFYVKKATILFDLKILYETIRVVISRDGFRTSGEIKRFNDSDKDSLST